MAKLIATRGAQRIMVAEFVFNYNDTAVDSVSGTEKTFGSTQTDALVLDAIKLPKGAVICGGEHIVETPYTGTTASTTSVGIAGSTTALANAVSNMAAAGTRTALTLTTTGFLSNTGTDIRLTLAHTVANATAGKVRVRVWFTLDNRLDEVFPN